MSSAILVKHHDGMTGCFDLHYAARTVIDQRSSALLEHLARISKQLSMIDVPAAEIPAETRQARITSVSPSRTRSAADDDDLETTSSAGDRKARHGMKPVTRLPLAEVSLLRLRDEVAILEGQLEQLRSMSREKDTRLIQAKQQLLQAQEASAAFFAALRSPTKTNKLASPRSQSFSGFSPLRYDSTSGNVTDSTSVLELGKQYLRHEETIRLLENSILEAQCNLERMSQQLAADDSEFVHAEKRKDKCLTELAEANAAAVALDAKVLSLQTRAAECSAERQSLQGQLDALTVPSLDANSVAQLEKRQKQLEEQLADAEEEIRQLRASDSDLQQSIAAGTKHGFTVEFGNLSLEVTTAMRRLHHTREAMMLLKAFIINLCEDLDTITETVQSVRDDPNFAAFSPFTEPSNAWRRNLLSAAYADVVALMRTQQHLTDAGAAAALLAKMKYFVIVYDLFSNHFDAVVAAVMATDGIDGMWASVLDMQSASDQCCNTISENKKMQARRRSSVVALTSRRPTNTGFSKGPLSN